MTLPRDVPPSAKLLADVLLVVMVAAILMLVITYYPKVESQPRFAPSVEKPSPRPLPGR